MTTTASETIVVLSSTSALVEGVDDIVKMLAGGVELLRKFLFCSAAPGAFSEMERDYY
jgi:hypothetical protein